jgi:hypothetical protein
MPNDALSIFSQAATKPAKSGKSKTPVIEIPALEVSIKEWLRADKAMSDAKAQKQLAEAVILPVAEEQRVRECRRDGEFHSSVKLNGQVLVSTQNQYTDIIVEDRANLEKVFGDKTDTYFKPTMEITLTDAALSDEKILQKLIAAVGQENLATYFTIKQSIKPTEQLHEQRTLDPEVAAKAKQLMDQGILKPYKPAVKIA